ncbi:hypothetical protein [Palaeococcus sp. (in: euryarchaeotes)]
MDVDTVIILFLTIWTLLDALLAHSTEIFLTILLIGTLITLELGEFFMRKESKDFLKSITYLLLIIFAIIVMKKVYEVLAG